LAVTDFVKNFGPYIKDFGPLATLVVGVMSLVGAAAIAIFSARKARHLEVFKLDLQRNELRIAIYAELQGNMSGLDQAIESLKFTQDLLTKIEATPDTEGATEYPTYSPSTVVYREKVKQIGILPAEVVTKVQQAYTALENLSSQILFLFDERVPFFEPKAGTRTSVPYAHLKDAIQVYADVRTIASDAIVSLKFGSD
jgi:hypothetical protein